MRQYFRYILMIGLLLSVPLTLRLAAQEESPANCTVSTDQARTVRVRVGFGENRTVVTFLPIDTEFAVVGQNTDDSGATWYALD